jgi:hypothetical protein
VPSYFSLLSDIRAFVATCGNLAQTYPLHPLASNFEFPPPTTPASLVSVPLDDINPVFTPAELANFCNATFVDNNSVLALARDMSLAVHQSINAAFLIFGWPEHDRRSSCLAQDKWDLSLSTACLYFELGLHYPCHFHDGGMALRQA